MSYESEFEVFHTAIEIENLFNELGTLTIMDRTRTVSTSVDAIKKLADLAIQSKNIEVRKGLIGLREQLITIKESLLEAREENLSLREENALLKRNRQPFNRTKGNSIGNSIEFPFASTPNLNLPLHDRSH